MISLDSSVSEKNGNHADSNTIIVPLTRIIFGNSVRLWTLLIIQKEMAIPRAI
jgi:hypothetical protein